MFLALEACYTTNRYGLLRVSVIHLDFVFAAAFQVKTKVEQSKRKSSSWLLMFKNSLRKT